MDQNDFDRAHRDLLAEIRRDARDTKGWTGRERFSDRVMTALARVPRHEFVLPEDMPLAYVNRPRGIGHGQTISQPYIVALMTDLLELDSADRVLEIGCGSGYQAAVLAEICAEVLSVEAVEELAVCAAARLDRLGYGNVTVRHGDGYEGWPEQAPFDAVIVTAAPEEVPPALIDQMKTGARMIVPVGRPYDTQNLILCRKDETGEIRQRDVLPVAFVPMFRRDKPPRPVK